MNNLIKRGDALRQMTNAEFAAWIWNITDCYTCPIHLNGGGCSRDCIAEWEQWLNEKMNEGEKL